MNHFVTTESGIVEGNIDCFLYGDLLPLLFHNSDRKIRSRIRLPNPLRAPAEETGMCMMENIVQTCLRRYHSYRRPQNGIPDKFHRGFGRRTNSGFHRLRYSCRKFHRHHHLQKDRLDPVLHGQTGHIISSFLYHSVRCTLLSLL